MTDGTRNIVHAMQAASVRRYVGLATPAVADERDKPTLKAKVLRTIPRLVFPNALTEITGMTDAVRNSGLDWTIARITSPSDKPAKGTIRAGFLGRDKVGSAMTRADIARFLVGQLADHTFLRAARPLATSDQRAPECGVRMVPSAAARAIGLTVSSQGSPGSPATATNCRCSP